MYDEGRAIIFLTYSDLHTSSRLSNKLAVFVFSFIILFYFIYLNATVSSSGT
jgi:hypothetical protein